MENLQVVLLLFSLFLVSCFTEKMCTKSEFLSDIHTDKMLSNSSFMAISTDGIMICARSCLFRSKCKSFNFNRVTGECHLNKMTLNSTTVLSTVSDFIFSDIDFWLEGLAGPCADHSCPLNSYCDPTDAYSYNCIITECLSLPNVDNGHFDVDPEESAIGTTITLTCDADYLPDSGVVCQENGTWSTAGCVLVTSCSLLKKLLPDSEDGEYWLVLTNISNYRARIYCHNMTSLDPQEYLTLTNVNYGIYPQVMNTNCDSQETELQFSCVDLGGEIWFSKIKIQILSMKVYANDLTFANISNRREYLRYGHAHDCYTYHHNTDTLSCGIKGNFTIDLAGTGWRISEDQQWSVYGWGPYMKPVERSRNGTYIFLQCGGYDGGCEPTGGLFLTPYPEDMSSE